MSQMSDDHKQPQPVSAPPIAPKKFLTNQGDNTLSKRLEKILPLTHDFDCLVGYFPIGGFFRLYPALEKVKKIRILIGLMNGQVMHSNQRYRSEIVFDGAKMKSTPVPLALYILGSEAFCL